MVKRGKLRVAVLFGGRSAEHEVSLRSAQAVLGHLDPERYEVRLAGITKHGGWLDAAGSRALLDGSLNGETGGAPLLPEGTECVFPVLHGPGGEDGTVQGWLELCGVPFVGAGCLGSAIGMDKIIAKRVLRDARLPLLNWSEVRARDFAANPEAEVARVLRERELPVFVKPSALGSSVGIGRASTQEELAAALAEALRHGEWALVEPALEVREFEIAVLDGRPPLVSPPGEIRAPDWYDYEAKYESEATEVLVPAPDVAPRMVEHMRELALEAFEALRLSGMARIDFFLGAKNGRLYLNEVNSIPGFTSISLYPRLVELMGIPFDRLCDRLIELAMQGAPPRAAPPLVAASAS